MPVLVRSSRLLLEQFLLRCPGGDLEARSEVQLLEDPVDVGRHRALGDVELLDDPAVGHFFGDENRYFRRAFGFYKALAPLVIRYRVSRAIRTAPCSKGQSRVS